jgi:response regulator RpfG family c-di-GMP phosphodiesterase
MDEELHAVRVVRVEVVQWERSRFKMNHKVLFVDDDRNLLEGFYRSLSDEFCVDTAADAAAGLEALASSGSFAVVVSDMRMPGMNGVEFLTAVRERWPDTVRLMFTGCADIQTAMDAVNAGCVFRFLTKPCAPEVLRGALRAAIAQYDLVMAERELLEKTLHGSVKVLTEILGLVNPAAFGRSSQIYAVMKHMVSKLGLREAWRYEMAAMLSQIGCVALDADTVEAIYSGKELSAAEQARLLVHPSIAFELLQRIPRLEDVAEMIAGQQALAPRRVAGGQISAGNLGAHLLRIAVDFVQMVSRGISVKGALKLLKDQPEQYYSAAVVTLETLPDEEQQMACQEISVREMEPGMILDQDLRLPEGTLLATRNQEVSYPLLVRIRTSCQKMPMVDKIRVKVPGVLA